MINNLRRISFPLLATAVVIVSAVVAVSRASQQGQAGPTGDLSVVGEVTVNGTAAISGATVFSESTVTTAKGSSAVVSLGKLGRVEMIPSSSMKLTFDDSSITATLSSGRVRVSTSSGVNAKVKTDDGEVSATGSQTNFTIDVRCGDTLIAVQKGKVTLRAGETVKQIAAGSQDSAGRAKPGCRR